jgi:hypothetical protein
MRDGAVSLGLLLVTLLACNGGEEQAKKIRRIEDNPEAMAELEARERARAAASAERLAAASAAAARPRLDPLRGIYAKVATDAVEQYEMVQRNKGSAMDLCAQAGLVSAAYLQAKDEEHYRTWKATEKKHCASAGVPQ